MGNQISLFSSPDDSLCEDLSVGESIIILKRKFFDTSKSDNYLKLFINSIPWRQDKISMFGKTHNLPRLQQWYGDAGHGYTWSGIKMDPLPWTKELSEIRDYICNDTGNNFNSVLLNLYRDGNDTVSYHSDDEPMLGGRPIISSISFGAERDLIIRKKYNHSESIKISLSNGSHLIMSGDTQSIWEHCIPRRRSIKTPRVNLTFRTIL